MALLEIEEVDGSIDFAQQATEYGRGVLAELWRRPRSDRCVGIVAG